MSARSIPYDACDMLEASKLIGQRDSLSSHPDHDKPVQIMKQIFLNFFNSLDLILMRISLLTTLFFHST
jgi:hypothetical protein